MFISELLLSNFRASTADAPVSIYASDAAGFVHVIRASLSAPPDLVARWRAHEFDCWCIASSDSCDRCEHIDNTGNITFSDVLNKMAAAQLVRRSELARLGESSGSSPLLASGGDDAKLRLWDLRAVPTTSGSTTSTSAIAIPRAAHILSSHTAGVTALAWHPTRSHLLASGRYNTLAVFESETGVLEL